MTETAAAGMKYANAEQGFPLGSKGLLPSAGYFPSWECLANTTRTVKICASGGRAPAIARPEMIASVYLGLPSPVTYVNRPFSLFRLSFLPSASPWLARMFLDYRDLSREGSIFLLYLFIRSQRNKLVDLCVHVLDKDAGSIMTRLVIDMLRQDK
jgi:hypothetical protein